jgi:DNA-binding FrmR family transcriptional regulator
MQSHSHSRTERGSQKVRLRRIIGQLNAVERMIEEERECSEILMQMVAARKALKALTETLIQSHMQHCIEHTQSPAEGRRQLHELLVVLKRYAD